MNKLMIIGNLTADPEVRTTPGGTTVCTFTVAVSRRFVPKDSNEKVTDFFRVQAWKQLGDNCAKYLAKGRKVAVVGELQAKLYEAKNGETRMSLDVDAGEVEFLSAGAQRTAEKTANDWDSYTEIQSSDIPF